VKGFELKFTVNFTLPQKVLNRKGREGRQGKTKKKWNQPTPAEHFFATGVASSHWF
jgi:hypothetical protein